MYYIILYPHLLLHWGHVNQYNNFTGYDPYSFGKEMGKLEEMSKQLETVKQKFDESNSKFNFIDVHACD